MPCQEGILILKIFKLEWPSCYKDPRAHIHLSLILGILSFL